MDDSCCDLPEGTSSAFIGHELPYFLSRVRPYSTTSTKTRNKLGVSGSAFPEVGRSHFGLGEKIINFGEQSVCIKHDANIKSAIADSQRSSMAFVQYQCEPDKFLRMGKLSPKDDGWRNRLKAAIEKSGRSQGDVATSCGLSRGYFTNVFRDGKEPTVGNLISIAHELNVSLSTILYGYDVSPETEEIMRLIEDNPDLRDGILKILKTRSAT